MIIVKCCVAPLKGSWFTTFHSHSALSHSVPPHPPRILAGFFQDSLRIPATPFGILQRRSKASKLPHCIHRIFIQMRFGSSGHPLTILRPSSGDPGGILRRCCCCVWWNPSWSAPLADETKSFPRSNRCWMMLTSQKIPSLNEILRMNGQSVAPPSYRRWI